MFSSVILVAASIAVFSTTAHKECNKLGDPGAWKCCKKFSMSKKIPSGPPVVIPRHVDKSKLDECFIAHDTDPKSCERDICIGKIMGYIRDDGTIDRKIFGEVLEMENKGTDILEKLKKNCFEGDASKFSPSPDMCDISILTRCHEAVLLTKCENWSVEEDCKGMKDLLPKCVE